MNTSPSSRNSLVTLQSVFVGTLEMCDGAPFMTIIFHCSYKCADISALIASLLSVPALITDACVTGL